MLMLSQEFCPPPLLSAEALSFSPFSLTLSPFRSLAGVGVVAVGSRLTVCRGAELRELQSYELQRERMTVTVLYLYLLVMSVRCEVRLLQYREEAANHPVPARINLTGTTVTALRQVKIIRTRTAIPHESI